MLSPNRPMTSDAGRFTNPQQRIGGDDEDGGLLQGDDREQPELLKT